MIERGMDFPTDPHDPPAPGAHLRIALCYAARMGRLPQTDRPRRFTQWVQRRKLIDRDPILPRLSDKIYAKRFVADRLGPEWVAPLLWEGMVLPPAPLTRHRAMLKSRHGCNQYRPLPAGISAHQWALAGRLARRWVRTCYGRWLDEWAYRDVPRGLMIEEWLGDGDALPVDYKIYVFGGVATHVQVHVGRGTGRSGHRWYLHDREWKVPGGGPALPRPTSLNAMIEAAECLASDTSFARVDFYELRGRPVFGEFCFYPGSGLDRFATEAIDFELGRLWERALSAPAPIRWLPEPIASQ